MSEVQLNAMVATWLEGRELGVEAQAFSFDVRGTRAEPAAVEVQIRRGDRTVVRRFDPAPTNCDALHAVVSLVIALALDPDTLPQTSPERAGGPAQTTPPEPPPVPHPSASAFSPQQSTRSLWFAQAQLGLAVLGAPSVGVGLGLETPLNAWLSGRVGLLAQYAPPSTLGTGEVAVAVGAAEARGCAGGPILDRLRMALCVGPALGLLRAHGSGYLREYSPASAWISVLAGVRIHLELGIDLLLDVDLVAPVKAPVLSVRRADGDLSERELGTVGLHLSLGAALP